MVDSSGAQRDDRLRAAGSLIWKDPQRILEAAAHLRGTGVVLECRLRGGSMEPAIPAGAALRVALDAQVREVGDVVAFVREDGVCVHRIARVRGERVVTQGDACHYPDPPVDGHCVLGRVTAWRLGSDWQAVAPVSGASRARAPLGRALAALVSGLLALDVRLGRGLARALRLRPEGAADIIHAVNDNHSRPEWKGK